MRGMGDTTAYLRRGIREIICLALFFFTFLACEYLFDVRIAEFVPSSEVVIYESLVIGASVIGFFVRPVLYYRRPHAIDATSDITGVLLVAALLLLIQDFSLLAAQRPALNHPLRGWRQTALQSHPSDRY